MNSSLVSCLGAKGEECVSIFSFIAAGHAVEARLEKALGNVELSIPKFSVLSILADAGQALTLSDLAAQMACVRSNITQLVDRLEADGFVRRVGDQDDRRSIRAELTDLGRAHQLGGAKEVERVQAEFSAALASFDSALLSRLIAAIS